MPEEPSTDVESCLRRAGHTHVTSRDLRAADVLRQLPAHAHPVDLLRRDSPLPAVASCDASQESCSHARLCQFVAHDFDLRAHGLLPHDRVAVCFPQGPHAALAVAAALCNYACVPVNAAFTMAEVAHQLEAVGARALVVFDAHPKADELRSLAARLKLLWLCAAPRTDTAAVGLFQLRAADSPWALPSLPSPAAPPAEAAVGARCALVLHTSGSTGVPKAVPLEHAPHACIHVCIPHVYGTCMACAWHVQVVDAACGWAHTALLLSFVDPGRSSRSGGGSPLKAGGSGKRERRERRGARPHPHLFVFGDLEGLFGQLLGTSIQFMLMSKLMSASCGFTPAMLQHELLPGAASMYIVGHIFFAVQGTLLCRRTAQPVTALPQGINIVTFFAFLQLIMVPTHRQSLYEGDLEEVAARKAYHAGLCACVLLGLLELVGDLPPPRRMHAFTPRAAHAFTGACCSDCSSSSACSSSMRSARPSHGRPCSRRSPASRSPSSRWASRSRSSPRRAPPSSQC